MQRNTRIGNAYDFCFEQGLTLCYTPDNAVHVEVGIRRFSKRITTLEEFEAMLDRESANIHYEKLERPLSGCTLYTLTFRGNELYSLDLSALADEDGGLFVEHGGAVLMVQRGPTLQSRTRGSVSPVHAPAALSAACTGWFKKGLVGWCLIAGCTYYMITRML
ncbi:ORF51 [Ranid herpesvirus 1]|uniref:ORF51 n=1 Tax=Ranid herpesvirus 1 TaxID=85655 RepID=Q14VQ7_9VIRU|nr:ORF51 [Ranid herpesvirus 1]ABG25815.1 ORF51 [Ranid herpesvirus 1]